MCLCICGADDVNASPTPLLNPNKLPVHIRLNVVQCYQSSRYAGFAAGLLAAGAGAMLTWTGRLQVRAAHHRTHHVHFVQVSKGRLLLVSVMAYSGVSTFSLASCLRSRNVLEQINVWQTQGQKAPQVQRGQDQAPPAQPLFDFDKGTSSTTDEQPATKSTTYEALRERNRAHISNIMLKST